VTVGVLAGRRVVVTRPELGSLGTALAGAAADVVHVPLICIEPPSDGGSALAAALADLESFDWLVVTSANGARAVGAAAGERPAVRLAAVGAATAAMLAGLARREVELVPARQRVEGLLAEFPPGDGQVLIAQADRAASTLADGLRALGHRVTVVEAYRTALREPSADELAALGAADAVLLASGSALEGWLAAGVAAAAIRPAVVAIGPSTAAAAERLGVRVAAVASTPADADVVAAVATALA
jgi:uroporphyrinogen-III synthase